MITKKYIAYIGINNPETITQIKVEISGLKHAVAVAKELITDLEQAIAIAELQKEETDAQNKSQGKEEGSIPSSDPEIEAGS